MKEIINSGYVFDDSSDNKLFVSGDTYCPTVTKKEYDDMAILHCCKSCHKKALGYEKNLDKDHHNYLTYRDGNNLYLNMIDPRKPLFKNELFRESFKFIDEHLRVRDVLVHCNVGRSRSPSVIMMYLAMKGAINSEEYCYAKSDFVDKYFKEYAPGEGITTFLTWSFEDLVRIK